MIDLDKFKVIHDRIAAGEALVAEHNIYGKYRFKMNQQANRISHKPLDEKAERHYGFCEDKMTEHKFNSMLLWGCFTIYTDMGDVTCDCCGGTGIVHEDGELLFD